VRVSEALIRMQRFFPLTTIPATAWRALLYSHEPATTFFWWVVVLRTRSAQTWRANGPPVGAGLWNR
jgi:hypothetical protein